MYVSCKTLFVCELSSFAHLHKFSLYYSNVNMPWYDSRYGPKFFKQGTGLLVANSLKLILVPSIMNFGLFLISSKEKDGEVGESMKTAWNGYESQQSGWFFFFLELAYFYFTNCLVLKLVLFSSRWTESFSGISTICFCVVVIIFFVELCPMEHLLMKYINLLDPIAGQRRICLVDICLLFLYTVVMETVKLKDPEG